MNGNAFIRMMREDIETDANKALYSELVDVMEYVVQQHPGCEIDSSKTVEECFKSMEDWARKNQKNNRAVVGHAQAISIVSEYLGLSTVGGEGDKPTAQNHTDRIKIEDFL